MLNTLPAAAGGVWTRAETRAELARSQPCRSMFCRIVPKVSWMTMSAPFACSMNHWFGKVSLEKTNLRFFHSSEKLTGPAMMCTAGQAEIFTPFSS